MRVAPIGVTIDAPLHAEEKGDPGAGEVAEPYHGIRRQIDLHGVPRLAALRARPGGHSAACRPLIRLGDAGSLTAATPCSPNTDSAVIPGRSVFSYNQVPSPLIK